MIYETAGVLGLDPGPFTLRELIYMVEGLRMETWQHTAAQLSMQANINRQKGGRVYGIRDFHPYMKRGRGRPRPIMEDAPIDVLKVFIDGN